MFYVCVYGVYVYVLEVGNKLMVQVKSEPVDPFPVFVIRWP